MIPPATPLSLNLRTLQLGGPAGWVDISDTECGLLQAMLSGEAQRVETACLLPKSARNEVTAKHALEVQIVRLRKKMLQAGAEAPTIKSIRGIGYQLCVPLQITPSTP